MNPQIEALLMRVRKALRWNSLRAHTEVCARGVGSIAGLSAGLVWHAHVDGRARLEVASPLSTASAFDGVRGTHTGPSGVLEPFELGDLDEFRMATALFFGSWVDPSAPFVLGCVAHRGDTIVLDARVGPEAWRQPFRIVLAASSLRPRRLETLTGDGAAFELDDYGPGVFCDVPRRLSWHHGWLADRVEITQVEAVNQATSYVVVDARGSRTVRVDRSLPSRVPSTRSPRGRLPLIRGAVDGHETGWFLLDTGAGVSALESGLANKLRLPSVGRTWVVTPTSGMGAAYRRAAALTIGPITLPEALLLDLDLAATSAALGVRLAGVLGFDLFAQTMVRIVHDPFQVELLSLDDTPSVAWHGAQFERRVAVLHAVLGSPNHADYRGHMTLDTANSAPVVLRETVARSLGLRQKIGRRAIRGVADTGGVADAANLVVGTLPWIDVGAARFENVRTLIAGSMEGTLSGATTLGSIGWGLFQRREIYLDWSRRRIAILHGASSLHA